MGNQRITDLTKVNNFSGDGDLIPIVINTGTVPVNASITKANFIAALNSGSFVTLDTAQTITGTKTFDIGNTDTKIVVNNLTETAKGIVINNDGGADVSQETVGLDINTSGYGYGLRVRNDDIGFGIYGEDNGNSAGIAGVSNGIGSALFGRANGGGKALFLTGDGSGDRIMVQNTSLQTVYTLDKDGNVNANSFRSSIVTATGVTGTYNLDYKATDNWDLTLTGATTLTESNLPASSEAQTLFIFATGGSLTLPATGTNYTVGTYDGAVNNWIVIKYFNSKRVITITQPD